MKPKLTLPLAILKKAMSKEVLLILGTCFFIWTFARLLIENL